MDVTRYSRISSGMMRQVRQINCTFVKTMTHNLIHGKEEIDAGTAPRGCGRI